MSTLTYNPNRVCHPGEHIEEYLTHYKVTVEDIILTAKIPKSSRENMAVQIKKVINAEGSITYAIAYVLNQGLYMPITWWLKLQENYDKHLKLVQAQ